MCASSRTFHHLVNVAVWDGLAIDYVFAYAMPLFGAVRRTFQWRTFQYQIFTANNGFGDVRLVLTSPNPLLAVKI